MSRIRSRASCANAKTEHFKHRFRQGLQHCVISDFAAILMTVTWK